MKTQAALAEFDTLASAISAAPAAGLVIFAAIVIAAGLASLAARMF